MNIVLVVAFLIIFLSAIITPILTFLAFSRIDLRKDKEIHNVHKDYITPRARLA